MTRHGLRRADHHLLRVVAQRSLDGIGFVDVTQRCGRAVRVQVIHLIGIHTRIAQRVEHGAARAVHAGRSHVTCIGAHAISKQFCIDPGTARLGVFVLFEHHHAGTFTQNKTITVLVPGARGRLGVVIAGGQGAHRGKAAHAQRRHCGLRTPCDHHVGIAIFNHASCFANAVQACCTGSHHRQIGALEPESHGHMARHHVDDGGRHEERRDTARAARCQFCVGVFDQRQAADAGANHATNARGQVFRQAFAMR
ncbi:hypothetical protein SDC9_117308 [bioreactor metagenome]|uniref:Uncharacterized protein n=1 Tax=bioreactor metagenome TaxID=1076179 RepID=A0A645C4S6_9ZZZZ